MDYTPEEIQAVVEKLVLSTIRKPYDTLGVRRTDLSFSDVQQAAAGVFILYPNSPFYVLYLGSQRLGDTIRAEATLIETLLDTIEATGLRVLPVEDVTTLFNAKAALQELGSAAGSRGGVFKDITKAPAFQRYSDNIQRFLDGPGTNVKNAGVIVQTPQQARSALPGLVTQLEDIHSLLLARVQGIADGIDDYNKVNLPAAVTSSVLSNSANLIGADAAALDVLTPTARLTLIRQTVLDILATRAVVTTFGSFSGPSDFYTLNGLGTPFADALRLATPATATGTVFGAAGIIEGVNDTLTLAADGGAPFNVLLNASLLAQLDGTVDDTTFIIGDGITPSQVGYTTPNNNKVKVKVDAITYVATLTVSATFVAPRTAEQVAANIQAALPAGVTAEGYYAPLRYSGLINIPAGINQIWTIPVPGASDFLALGVTAVGHTAHVLSGPNAGFYPITAVTTDTITVVGTTVAQLGALIEIGPANRRVRIRCSSPSTQLPIETTLSVYGDDAISKASLLTLGFFNQMSAQCTRTTPDLVATDVNFKTQSVVASMGFQPSLVNVPARGDVLAPTQVTFSRTRATGSQSFVLTTLTYTVTALTLAGTVVTGDVLVLRDGPNPGQWYTITTVNGLAVATPQLLAVGDVVVATGTMTGLADPAVSVEIGPAVAAVKYDLLTVNSGPNNGQYFVKSQGLTPLDIILQLALPLPFTGVTALDMVVSFGKVVLLLKSIKKTIESQVTVSGPSALLFFSSSPTTARGTTPWFQLPSVPRGLQGGDILETYLTDYKLPSASYTIAGISGRVIQVRPELPSETSWQFTVQPPPFARLRVGTLNDYSAVRTALRAWLELPVNQPAFFRNLNRLVNPLLVNTNPTAVQVGSALAQVRLLYSFLLATQAVAGGQPAAQALDNILGNFTVEPVTAVDSLLHSFIAKGSTRATDLLLSGQFSTFFSLTVDGASYAGAFQEAARAVAMTDLAVRSVNRAEVQRSRLLSQSVSPDFEYAANSVSESQVPDTPQGFGEPSDFGKIEQ